MNPLWVARGEGPFRLAFPLRLPEALEIGADQNELFSQVIDHFADDLRTLFGPAELQRLPLSWIPLQRFHVKWCQDGLKNEVALMEEHSRRVAVWEKNALQKKSKLTVDTSRATVTITAMSSGTGYWKALVGRLRAVTSAPRAKAQAARELKVTRQAVNNWIKDRSAPSAELTLRLLLWVQQAEAQQTKNPGSASTPPGPNTQVRRL